jgi:hypothetical protein
MHFYCCFFYININTNSDEITTIFITCLLSDRPLVGMDRRGVRIGQVTPGGERGFFIRSPNNT